VIAVVRALRSNLRDVQRAVTKMDAGTYGICERCGRRISLERLEALPWAVRCIDCQQRAGGR
jgi:RNA polymerase-binding transcription factor DksA